VNYVVKLIQKEWFCWSI